MRKKISKFAVGIALLTPLAIAISCGTESPKMLNETEQQAVETKWLNESNNLWDSQITFNLKAGWQEMVITDMEKNLTTEINKLKNEDTTLQSQANVNVKINLGQNDEVIIQNVESKKTDFGISSISAVNQANHQAFHPLLQTRTNGFTFDPEFSNYQNGLNDDSLIKIANKTNQALKDHPYTSLTSSDFNGSIYPVYYDQTNQINFYRGAIFIAGDDATLAAIRKAWNDRDWNTFRNFGIVTGETTSGGSWKLQAALLNKHFNQKGNQSFTTLNEDKISHPSKWATNGSNGPRDLQNGNFKDFHIAFGDEGSFAYTSRYNENQELQSNYFNPTNGKLEILSVTEPLKYDVGIFRQDFNAAEAKIITQAWINLAQTNKDLYGPTVGYNSYEKITETKIANEIYTKWQETMQ